MHSGEPTGAARSIARTAIVALAVALALSACTGSPPTPPPATSASTAPPTPTTLPSPTPTVDLTVLPVRPEAMSTPSADGAAAAAAYFTQLYAYAYATGDLADWKAMSEPDCQFCNNVIDSVTEMVAAGESNSSAEIEVTDPFGTEIDPGVSYSAMLKMHQGPSEQFDSAGRVLRTGDGGSYELYFAIAWRDGWFVREIDTKSLDETSTPLPTP